MLFIGTSFVGPAAVMALVVVVLGLASLEFFTQTSARNLGTPMVVGVVAAMALFVGGSTRVISIYRALKQRKRDISLANLEDERRPLSPKKPSGKNNLDVL